MISVYLLLDCFDPETSRAVLICTNRARQPRQSRYDVEISLISNQKHSYHGMIRSFQGIIRSYHGMIRLFQDAEQFSMSRSRHQCHDCKRTWCRIAQIPNIYNYLKNLLLGFMPMPMFTFATLLVVALCRHSVCCLYSISFSVVPSFVLRSSSVVNSIYLR